MKTQDLSRLEYVYADLIRLGLTDMSIAIKTDSMKANLRNVISNITGKDCQYVQEHFEYEAMQMRDNPNHQFRAL